MKIHCQTDDFELATADLEGIAYKCGYDLTVTSDHQIDVRASKDEYMMPIIDVIAKKDGDKLTYDVFIEFPDIDMQHVQRSYAHWLAKWMEISNLVDAISKFEYMEF